MQRPAAQPIYGFHTPDSQVREDALSGEGGKPLHIQVTVSEPQPHAVRLSYSVAGTADARDGYQELPGECVIPALSRVGEIVFQVVDDKLQEVDETIVLTLTTGSLYNGKHTVTIDDDDLPKVGFATDAATVVEDVGTVSVELALSTVNANRVVAYYGVDGSAAPGGVDFGSLSGRVSFPPGQQTARIDIELVDDDKEELKDEDVVLTLLKLQGGKLNTESFLQYKLTIRDNEEPSVLFADAQEWLPAYGVSKLVEDAGDIELVVELSRASDETVTVHYALAGSAKAGEDYLGTVAGALTFLPGDTAKTIPISLVDDTTFEEEETFVATLSEPTNAACAARAACRSIFSTTSGPSSSSSRQSSRYARAPSFTTSICNSRTFTARPSKW